MNWVKKQLEHPDYLPLPSSDTIHYRIKQLFSEDEHIVSHRGIVHRFNINTPLNKALAALAVRLNPTWRTRGQVLDYDNTIIKTEKPDSSFTYKKYKGYTPGVLFVNGLPLYVEGRGGNSNSKYLMADTLERGINILDNQGIKTKAIRIDGAAYQENVFHWLYSRPELIYYVRANKEAIHNLDPDRWEPIMVGDTPAQAQIIHSSPPGLEDHACRKVVYRMINPSEQQDLYYGGYTYQFLLTNDIEHSAEYIINFYNQRGNCERAFDILKHDFNWNQLPFASMDQNTVYLIFTAMANLIFDWFKKLLAHRFPTVDITQRVKRFNLYFVNIPGKWIRTARQTKLKIYSTLPYDQLLKPG